MGGLDVVVQIELGGIGELGGRDGARVAAAGCFRAPGSATATVWPAATLGAPQTIGRSPSPVSTMQALSRSAFGCFSHLTTLPTTKPSLEGGPTVSIRSTSVPVITSRSARYSSDSRSVTCSQYSLSHEYGTLIPDTS